MQERVQLSMGLVGCGRAVSGHSVPDLPSRARVCVGYRDRAPFLSLSVSED